MFRYILPALVVTVAATPLLYAQDAKPDPKINAAFLELVRAGDPSGLDAFWRDNPVFSSPEKLGEALREAIVARDETLAQAIVAKGVTPEERAKIVNAADAQGRNALFYAVDVNSPSLAIFLLSHGADTSQKAVSSYRERHYSNQTPLQRAYTSDNPGLLQVLLNSKNPETRKALTAQTSSEFGTYSLLTGALAAGNRELVKAVLARNPNLKPSHYANQVWRAAAVGGDLENVKALIAAGAPLVTIPRDPLNESASTALLEAARWNRLEMVTFLLANGADVNAAGGRGVDRGGRETPLLEAIKTGNAALVDLLLIKGANVNPRLDFGLSPLALALNEGEFVTARKLLNQGANFAPVEADLIDIVLRNDLLALAKVQPIKATEYREGVNLMHYAALFGTPATLDALARSNVPQKADRRGQTPIFWAVRANNLPAVQWFLKNGADAAVPDSSGQNLLHLAAFKGSAELIQVLLAAKVDPNLAIAKGPYGVDAYKTGVTPLHRAALYGNSPALEALVAAKADLNALTEAKLAPLHYAAMSGQTAAVKTLLKHGASVKVGESLLLSVASETNFAYVWSHPIPRPFPVPDRAGTASALLAAGVAVGDVDSQGRNALLATVTPFSRIGDPTQAFAEIRDAQMRAEGGVARARLIQVLAKGGVDVNARAKIDANREYGLSSVYRDPPLGPTALHMAVKNQDLAATRALLENGANAALEDGTGRTPMDVALRRGEHSLQRYDVPFANPRASGFADWQTAPPLLLDGSIPREIIALLHKHGGDKMGRGPFLQAAAWGAAKWVKSAVATQPELLKAQAHYREIGERAVVVNTDPLFLNVSGASLAITNKHPDLAIFLVNKGEPLDPMWASKRNLLFIAAIEKDWKTVDVLLQKGAKWEVDWQENTPLHLLAQSGDVEAIRELLKRGVPKDLKNKSGMTAVKSALWTRKTEAAQVLREAGVPE